MPKRTNEKQEVVALLRRTLAGDKYRIAESKMLRDARTGVEREVDVVVESAVDDIPMVVSFETIAHSRKGDVEWVEQMIKKHEGLPTNRLVLVSWSGFTKGARRLAEVEPKVMLIAPQSVTSGGKPQATELTAAEVNLKITKVVLVVDLPGTENTRVVASFDTLIVDHEGTEVSTVQIVAADLVKNQEVGRRLMTDLAARPDRDEVKYFVVGVPLAAADFFLRHEASGRLDRALELEVTGEVALTQTRFNLEHANFGEILFGYGTTEVAGRKALVVAVLGKDGAVSRATTRVYSGDWASNRPSPRKR